MRVHFCFLGLSVVWLPLLRNNHRAHSRSSTVRASSRAGRQKTAASVVRRLGSDYSNCAVNLAHLGDFGSQICRLN